MVYHKGKGLDLTRIRICWVPHGDHAANFCGPEITVTGKFNWEAKSIFVCLLSHLWDLGQWPWTFYNMHYRANSLTWPASVLNYTNIESFYIRQEFNKPLLVCCAFPIAGPRRTWPIVFSYQYESIWISIWIRRNLKETVSREYYHVTCIEKTKHTN